MRTRCLLYFVLALLVCAASAPAKDRQLSGLLAASVGESVVLVEPNSGLTVGFDTGPVGWLFPAPGGILFAPDVINNRTAVINLRSQAVVDRLDGLTMPHFGETPDRYIAIAGEIVLLSYPDRAVMARIAAEIGHPWQVIVAPDNAAMLVLERLPDASTGAHMSLVNLISRQVSYRQPLTEGIHRMALSPYLGLIALADETANRIHLAEPSTLTPVAAHGVDGKPIDVAFTHNGRILATAIETGDGSGVLELALFKSGKKKGLRLDKEVPVALPGSPVRIATSPDTDRVAVALDGGTVVIVDVEHREVVGTIALPGTPRDLRWCDPTREGPMIPEWSEGENEPSFGPFAPKVKDDKSSGLEEPPWIKKPN